MSHSYIRVHVSPSLSTMFDPFNVSETTDISTVISTIKSIHSDDSNLLYIHVPSTVYTEVTGYEM